MAIVTGGKHFGQYTYEHWFDEDDEEKEAEKNDKNEERYKLSKEKTADKELADKD